MRRSKIVAGLLAAVLAGGLSACGGPEGGGGDSDTVTIMAPLLVPEAPPADNPVHRRLEEIIGKKLQINWTPDSSYEDRTNITLAGDDVPDLMIFKTKTAGFIKNAQAGAFWDLTDKLKDYPNLVSDSPDVQKASSVNGRIFGLYRARDPIRHGVIIRKDWLTKLGLEPPKTTEDLYALAKAFTEQDPDGNGKDDTTGLLIPKWPGAIGTDSPYDVLETWFGAGNKWVERDGRLIPSFMTEEFIQANAFVRKLADEGLMNGDFATMDSTTWNQPFYNGKAGIIIDVLDRGNQILDLFAERDQQNLASYVEITGQLTGPDGTLHAYPTQGYAGFIVIPKARVRTEEQLKEILGVLDKWNSREAEVTMSNGIEGQSFTVEDGYAVPAAASPENDLIQRTVKTYPQLRMNVNGPRVYELKQPSEAQQALLDRRFAIWKEDLKSAVYNPAAPYVSDTYVSKGAQLDNIMADARIKFIAGQLDEQGLRDAIKLWESSGGAQIIEETNALYRENQ